MSTVNTGWLEDNNGEKFAPKTLGTQVFTSDGQTLEGVVNNISNKIDNIGIATSENAGLSKFGDGLNISDDGTASVRTGDGMTIDANGAVASTMKIQLITWEAND